MRPAIQLVGQRNWKNIILIPGRLSYCTGVSSRALHIEARLIPKNVADKFDPMLNSSVVPNEDYSGITISILSLRVLITWRTGCLNNQLMRLIMT